LRGAICEFFFEIAVDWGFWRILAKGCAGDESLFDGRQSLQRAHSHAEHGNEEQEAEPPEGAFPRRAWERGKPGNEEFPLVLSGS